MFLNNAAARASENIAYKENSQYTLLPVTKWLMRRVIVLGHCQF